MPPREIDECRVLIGPPRCGKTTLARKLAGDALIAGDWVFAHDPGHQFGFPYYRDTDAWRSAIAKAQAEKRGIPRAASVGGSADALAELAEGIGERVNTANNVRMPMWLIYDEATLLDTSGASYIGERDRRLLAVRRHRGIGLVYLMQRVGQLPRGIIESANRVYLFRQPQPKHIGWLEESASLPPGTLAVTATLPPHRYLEIVPGVGCE